MFNININNFFQIKKYFLMMYLLLLVRSGFLIRRLKSLRRRHRYTLNRTHNQSDNFIYQIEKQFKELGGNLSDEKRKPLKDAIIDAKKVFADSNASADTLNSIREKLATVFQGMVLELYSHNRIAGHFSK